MCCFTIKVQQNYFIYLEPENTGKSSCEAKPELLPVDSCQLKKLPDKGNKMQGNEEQGRDDKYKRGKIIFIPDGVKNGLRKRATHKG